MLKEYEHRLDEVTEKTALPEPLRKYLRDTVLMQSYPLRIPHTL